MKRLNLNVDGQEIEVWAQKRAGKLWLHFDGQTHLYEPQGSLGSAAKKDGGDPGQIMAPMPGKVIKILKKSGEKVSDGETVIVMEAMKMEYNLKAIQEMKIEKILCQENQNVTLGQKLVELKEV